MFSCLRSICVDQQIIQESILQNPLNELPIGASTVTGYVKGFLYRFEARLNSSWQTALFIKWYAVLINVVEACLAVHEMTKLKRAKVGNTGSIISGSWSRKLHFVTELLSGLSNLLAIAGLVLPNGLYLLPYLYIHLIILVLELNYFVTGTLLNWASQKPPTNIRRTVRRSASSLVFIVFNLLIMTGARFATIVRPGASTST